LYPFADTVARDGITVDDAVEQIDIGKHLQIVNNLKKIVSCLLNCYLVII
jgi:AICAR transformylase/IMP cyclohydrolase PurH